MRAAVLRAHGAPPEPGEFPDPTPAAGEIVVDVLAGGMNPVEIGIASGKFYGLVPPLPSVVGREGVGRTGDGKRAYFFGCVTPFGSFAERALVDDRALVPLPDEIDDGLAVALGTAGLAAWVPFARSAQLRDGDSVLVLGASGVVGQLAIQTARLQGAGRVVAAARSAEGLKRARQLGADAVASLAIAEKFAAELREHAGDGFDVVLDLIWGDATLAAIAALAPWGRLVQVGSAGSDKPLEVTPPMLRSRNAALIGYTSALLTDAERRAAYETLLGHASAGRLSVEVERIALEDVARAWAAQQAGPRHKLVVVP